MSIYNDTLGGLCENLRTAMEDYQGVNYAFNSSKMNGALDFILGPQNDTGAIEVTQLQDQNGKLRKARVVYKQPFDLDDVVTGATAEAAGLCDTSTEPEPKDVTVEIDDAVSMTAPLGFTEAKLRLYCENPQAFMQEYLLGHLARQREKLDQSILTAINVDAGVNYEADGTKTAADTSKSVDILTSTGLPNVVGFDEIIADYENNQLNGIPAVIGQGNFDTFVRLQNLTCCNSSTPFVQSVQELGVAFYKDQQANATLGSNEILVVAPGASKLLTYNENSHIMLADNPLARHITIPDPVYGNALTWDLDFKWDECNKKWIWFTRLYFKVFNTFQSDSFPSGSIVDNGSLRGMTGIFKYTAAKAS